MKTIIATAARRTGLSATLKLTAFATLAVVFWCSAGSRGLAQGETCSVCHKGTTTLTFPCTSLEYRRHLDHGDPMGACQVTPTGNQ